MQLVMEFFKNMKVINNVESIILARKQLSLKSIGFVPTMGNLHSGHAELIKNSINENDQTFVSIYVNPLQFKNKVEIDEYPRTIEKDINLCDGLGVNYLFIPSDSEMYPNKNDLTINEKTILSPDEEKLRTGFGEYFSGMLLIVNKLFNIVKPTNAYFGEKDYTQLLLVERMVQSLFLDINIIPCPIIRNKNGIPLSSCHNLLTKEELEMIQGIPKIIHSKFKTTTAINNLTNMGVSVEYLVDIKNRRFLSIKVGRARLTDNFELK